MAATGLLALEAIYDAVGTLPTLYVGELPVPANREAPPYALLAMDYRPTVMNQAGASVGGKVGVQHEVLRATFTIWTFSPADNETAVATLLNVLTPKAAVVTNAKTLLAVTTGGPDLARRGQSQRAGGIQRTLGDVSYTDRLYASTVAVKLRIDYS